MHDAILIASDPVFDKQTARTAIPRRFSAVTRQIWVMQARLTRTRGKRAMRILADRSFRAAYDFLLLRAEQDQALTELAEFWTEAQIGYEFPDRTRSTAPKTTTTRRRGGHKRRGRKR